MHGVQSMYVNSPSTQMIWLPVITTVTLEEKNFNLLYKAMYLILWYTVPELEA